MEPTQCIRGARCVCGVGEWGMSLSVGIYGTRGVSDGFIRISNLPGNKRGSKSGGGDGEYMWRWRGGGNSVAEDIEETW